MWTFSQLAIKRGISCQRFIYKWRKKSERCSFNIHQWKPATTCETSCLYCAQDLPLPFMGFTSLLLEETLLGVVDTVAVGVPGLTSLLLPAPPPGFPDTAEPAPACFPLPDSFFTTCCWPPPVTPSPTVELPPLLPPVEDDWDAFCCANLSCLRNLARRFWNHTCKITWEV